MLRLSSYSKKVHTIRLTPRDEEKLEKLCEETQRSKSYFIRLAVKEFLEEEALYRIALDRWEDKNDPIITSKQLHEELGI